MHPRTLCLAAIAALATTAAAHADLLLDFQTDALGQPIRAGQVIDDEYQPWGVNITADTHRGYDVVITFDSANPTGNDTDLVTPGYGSGNTEPLGNMLIMPKDIVDADHDGYVDDPDDHATGRPGSVVFTFDRTYEAGSLTFIDIEESGGKIFFARSDGAGGWSPSGQLPIPTFGDNSVQTIDFAGVALFDRMTVELRGSGAMDSLRVTGGGVVIPEPASVALFACGGLLMAPSRWRRVGRGRQQLKLEP
mgnify:FL=1